jgi:regulator of protease activity HflC (stomatin/prohibitin superfamily)
MSLLSWFFVSGAAVVCVLFITHFIWLPWLLLVFARNDFFVTTSREGTAKARLRYGRFGGMLKPLPWEGHCYDDNWEVVDIALAGASCRPVALNWIEKLLPKGILWLGIPFANTTKVSHLQWTGLRQGSLSGEIQTAKGTESLVQQDKLDDLLISRDEEQDYILLMDDVYCINFKDTEDVEMIPLSFIAIMTLRVVNPYKALFRTEQWLEQTINFLRPYVKVYVGNKKYADLASTNSGTGTETLADILQNVRRESDSILELPSPTDGETIKEYLRNRWGIHAEHLNLVDFKTGEGPRGDAYQKAAATKYMTQREAEGIAVLAEAEAGRIKTIAGAEAERVTKVADAVTKGGDVAILVRRLEALESVGEGGNLVVVDGNNQQLLIPAPERKSGKRKEAPKP